MLFLSSRNGWSRRSLFAFAAAATLFCAMCSPLQAQAVCKDGPGKGAQVDAESRCRLFFHYAPDDLKPDPRIARNLKLADGEFARSIAVVVGISKYQNSAYDLPAAAVDVGKLKDFLGGSQHFDEIIVLENGDATIENIRYFLRTYAFERSNLFKGKVRFLFAYSGHGLPVQFTDDGSAAAGPVPSVGLVLSAAKDDNDVTNIYGLNELRALFNDLAKNSYQFLALINACYGGDVFGIGKVGGDPNDIEGPSALAITAGPSDQKVVSLGEGQGSLFFEKLMNGVKDGSADQDARNVTMGIQKSPKAYYGIVRLGALDSYLSEEMLKTLEANAPESESLDGNRHHWMGSVEPETVLSRGGFFFLQDPPPPPKINAQLKGFDLGAFASVSFTPSRNQLAFFAPAGAEGDDGFGALRSSRKAVRGVDVSHLAGDIDWSAVANADVHFAYMKATQGDAFVDSRFQANWAGALKVGLARGAYHTFSFCVSPESQAAAIISKVKMEKSDLPVAVDVELFPGQEASTVSFLAKEGACAKALGNDGLNNAVKTLLVMLRSAYGRAPVLYGNDYLLDTVLSKDLAAGFPLWRANYKVKSGAPQPPWSLWQFSESEKVAGIAVPVDVDVLSRAP